MKQPADPTTPMYEGRELPRPDDELVDQGLAFDVTTLLARRQMLKVVGLGLGTLGLAACGADNGSPSAATTTSGTSAAASGLEIPDETAGPYPGDGSNGPDVLEQSGIVREDIRSSFGTSSTTAEGVPMTIELTVTDLQKSGAGMAGAAVYVWQCDQEGRYSMYSDGVTGENYLRGVQIADDAGKVRFTSVFPACYPGRWPHIHFEVYPDQASITDSNAAIATSQIALPKEACEAVYATEGYSSSLESFPQVSLSTDMVFRDGGGATQLATVNGDATKGYTVALTAPIDTATAPSGGGMPGGAPPAPR